MQMFSRKAANLSLAILLTVNASAFAATQETHFPHSEKAGPRLPHSEADPKTHPVSNSLSRSRSPFRSRSQSLFRNRFPNRSRNPSPSRGHYRIQSRTLFLSPFHTLSHTLST